MSKTFKDKEKNLKDKIKNPKLEYSRKRKYKKDWGEVEDELQAVSKH